MPGATVKPTLISDVSSNTLKTENAEVGPVIEIPKESRRVEHSSENTTASASEDNTSKVFEGIKIFFHNKKNNNSRSNNKQTSMLIIPTCKLLHYCSPYR